ncbi:MAG: helix-turn-helix transcriptional regulator [Rhodoglobus sp.]
MNESRIDQLRISRGWTQERLATESGIAVRTIQRLEAGNEANLETLSRVANALGVAVRDLFVNVEKEDFQTAVTGLDARASAQQAKRDATMQGYEYLYRGIGVLVTFATIVLVLTRTLPQLGWFIIPAYWAGVRYLFRFFVHFAIDPRLDAKYPLSLPSRSRAEFGPESY